MYDRSYPIYTYAQILKYFAKIITNVWLFRKIVLI